MADPERPAPVEWPTRPDPGPVGAEHPSVLAVCDFSANLSKIERHIGPLAATADPTMVCITGDEDVDGVAYRTVSDLGWRPIGLCLMFLAALLEARRNEYDAVVSFSLVPHGCFALVGARLAGLPAHLGIIGEDLDVHARAWYAPAIAFLFRRFDVVSVPGRTHRQRLVDLGVLPTATAILSNPIDADRFRPDETAEPDLDLLWVGRFSPEKDPVRFVDACETLHERGVAFSAAMVGDGHLRPAVEARVREAGLAGSIELTGWVDEPLAHYRRARIFSLTSRRDALPLTLVEAMATGCVPVVPDVGNVTDAAVDGENAVVVGREPDAYADAFEALLGEPDRQQRLANAATVVRERYSYEAATGDWRSIIRRLDEATPDPRIVVEEP